jgi:hypothetical protein
VDGVALGRVSALLWFFVVIITPMLDTHRIMLLVSEGQTGKVWTPAEEQSFGYLCT